MYLQGARFLGAAFLAASLAITAGCGGGGSSNGPTSSTPLVPGSNQVAGPADPVQDLLTQLSDGAGDVPVLGDTVSALVGALVSLLDAPDGLASGFQDFLLSQDPQDLITGGQDAGDAILSFAAGLSDTLIQLSEEGEAIPGLDAVLPQLLALQEMVRDGFTGTSDGGNLTLVTDTLVEIAGSLGALSGQVPPAVQDAPLVGALLATLGQGSQDLATTLDAVGQLDGKATSDALLDSFTHLLTGLTGALPGGFDAQLTGAVDSAKDTFSGGLALLLDPLFRSLSAVLGPVTGQGAPLNNILPGLLSGNLAGLGGISGLGSLLEGGGTSSGGLPIPVLGDLLAGLPLLGDLLGGILGGASAGGGLPVLGDVLGGGGNLPLLGDLLQGLPGLSAPGSSAPASLPIIGDLLTSILSLNDGGLPILGDILADGGNGAGGLDIPVIGGLLDGLLGGLLGQAGGLDANGGFLGGLSGVPVLGGLVGGLLGGLLGG